MKSWMNLAAVLCLGGAMTACNGGSDDGCSIDTDCKGDRICDTASGMCVGPDDDGPDASGQGGAGGQGGTGGQGGQGGAGGGGGGLGATCSDLCDRAPADNTTADCVADVISERHPSVAGNEDCIDANDSTAVCGRCYTREAVSEQSCGMALSACFGGGQGGEGGQGEGGEGGQGEGGEGGQGEGGEGGQGDAVQDCADLCAFVPVDPATANCVAAFMAPRHPAVLSEPVCSQANAQSGVCEQCYDDANVTDASCVAAWRSCF